MGEIIERHKGRNNNQMPYNKIIKKRAEESRSKQRDKEEKQTERKIAADCRIQTQ